MTHRSRMMDQLYGKEIAAKVYARCEELGESFNELVQNVAYDIFWARPGLSLRDKSLVTVCSLIVLNKEEQLVIHLTGFFHQGGTPEGVKALLNYLGKMQYIASKEAACAIVNSLPVPAGAAHSINLSPGSQDKAMIDFAVHIALGDNAKTEACVRSILAEGILSRKEMEDIMIQQSAYCGFPCAMNGYAVLHKIQDAASNADSGTPAGG